MVRTFLKVYMELGSYFLFLQEQIKDIIIKDIIIIRLRWAAHVLTGDVFTTCAPH
jgi:hypothetical protein